MRAGISVLRHRTNFKPKRSRGEKPRGRAAMAESLERRVLLAYDILIAQSGGSPTIPAGATTLEDNGSYIISPAALDSATTDIVLAANDQITFADAVNVTTPGVGLSATAKMGIVQQQSSIQNTIQTTNGAITFSTPAAALSVTVPLNAGAAPVLLLSGAGITQISNGVITAANLGVQAAGNIDLAQTANSISGAFAAINSSSGAFVHLRSSAALTIGAVPAAGVFPGAPGISTHNGDVSIATAAALNLSAPVNAGTGTVRLGAHGNITQSPAAPITAANLSSTGSNATVDLSEAANAVAGSFTARGSTVRFTSGAGLTVGSVTGDSVLTGLSGINTSGGDVTLVSTQPGSALTLGTSVYASITGTVRLASNGGIVQGFSGMITADSLGMTAAGNIDLGQALNTIGGTFGGEIAAVDTAAGAFVHVRDNVLLPVGTVSASGAFAAVAGIATNGGDVTLLTSSGDPLMLNSPINAGGGTVRLVSQQGVLATGGVALTAANLSVMSAGQVALPSVNKISGTVALSSGSGPLQFTDADGFTVGSVAGDSLAFTAVAGASARGSITLDSQGGPLTVAAAVSAAQTDSSSTAPPPNVTLDSQGGPLTLQAPVSASNAAVATTGPSAVYLISAAGISETAAATITSEILAIKAAGNVELATANNAVMASLNNKAAGGTLAVSDSAAGGFVHLRDTAALFIFEAAANGLFPGASGITTNNGDVTLISGPSATGDPNSLEIARPLSAGTGTVRLNAAGPVANSFAASAISAANLSVLGAGDIVLGLQTNDVGGTFAASDTAPGAFVQFVNGPGFSVAAVPPDSASAGASAVSTLNGDISLVSETGSIALAAPVNAAIGGATVRLKAAGSVTQSASASITAAALSVQAAGNIDLAEDVNSIDGALAASDTGSGAFIRFQSMGDITIGAITANVIAGGATGLSTNNGNITLNSPTNINISQPITAGAGTVTLSPLTGGVQDAAPITAGAIIQPGGVNSTYGGPLQASIPAGIQLTGNAFTITGSTITLDAGPLDINCRAASTMSSKLVGPGGMIKDGAGTLTLNATRTLGESPLTVNGGALVVGLPDSTPNPASNTVTSLTINTAAGAKLDLATSSLTINYAGSTDPVATIRSYLSSGYAGGAWTGPGLITSSGLALGYADAADGVVSSLAPGTLLIQNTRPGDANVDRTVGFADLVILARHYGSPSATWDQGDFNYDGKVDFSDLVILARNYGKGSGAAAALAVGSSVPTPTTQIPRLRRRIGYRWRGIIQ